MSAKPSWLWSAPSAALSTRTLCCHPTQLRGRLDLHLLRHLSLHPRPFRHRHRIEAPHHGRLALDDEQPSDDIEERDDDTEDERPVEAEARIERAAGGLADEKTVAFMSDGSCPILNEIR
jgi:hypothetical protein